ncbi:putative quinate permease [Fusarium oxysporum f. sp. albedinis]|nr:putative quinate permease [Fusarium oxysporum f. sp. albedinis]
MQSFSYSSSLAVTRKEYHSRNNSEFILRLRSLSNIVEFIFLASIQADQLENSLYSAFPMDSSISDVVLSDFVQWLRHSWNLAYGFIIRRTHFSMAVFVCIKDLYNKSFR